MNDTGDSRDGVAEKPNVEEDGSGVVALGRSCYGVLPVAGEHTTIRRHVYTRIYAIMYIYFCSFVRFDDNMIRVVRGCSRYKKCHENVKNQEKSQKSSNIVIEQCSVHTNYHVILCARHNRTTALPYSTR